MVRSRARKLLLQARSSLNQILAAKEIPPDMNDSLADVVEELEYQIRTIEYQWREDDDD